MTPVTPVTPVMAVCDARHEALTEGVSETPHHLPHALMMHLEWVAKEGDQTKNTINKKHQCVGNIALIVVTVLLNWMCVTVIDLVQLG